MDGRHHAKWYAISCIPFFFYLGWKGLWWFIPLAIVASAIVDPDEDQKWLEGKTHRNGFTHSILFPLYIATAFALPMLTYSVDLFWMMYRGYILILCFPAAIHLTCDLPGKNYEGKARIWLWHRLSPIASRIWIVVNILIAIVCIFV